MNISLRLQSFRGKPFPLAFAGCLSVCRKAAGKSRFQPRAWRFYTISYTEMHLLVYPAFPQCDKFFNANVEALPKPSYKTWISTPSAAFCSSVALDL